MENITFENNPQDNSRVVVFTSGVHVASKAAKLDNIIKRPVLLKRYEEELAKMSKVVNQTAAPALSYDVALGRLGISSVYYASMAQVVSARKLKVKGGVVDKGVLSKYNKSIEGMRPVEVKKEEVIPTPLIQEEVKVSIPLPKVSQPENVLPPINDTRVARLERTGEIPVVKQEVPMPAYQNNVINTPERFITKNEERPIVTPLPSRVERVRESEVRDDSLKTAEIGKGAKELDKINTLIHGNEVNDLSLELQNAHKRLEEAVRENQRVVNQSATLEEQIRNVKETVEKLRKEKTQAQQRELDKTLDMLEATKEENLGATRRMTNLQAELAELIRQRDEMLSDQSYSRGRAA